MNELLNITDKEQLVRAVSDLINFDFPRLVQALYRIDVSEQKLRQVLKDNNEKDAAELIAGLIIQRQLEKQKSRKENRGSNEISDEEKW